LKRNHRRRLSALNNCADISTFVPVRTVTLSKDAYDSLAALKHEGESFSEVVRRLTGSQVLLSAYVGAWSGAPKERIAHVRRYLRTMDRASRQKLRRLTQKRPTHGEP